MQNNHNVTTLEEYMNNMPEFDIKNNYQFFYRGQNNVAFPIVPSAMRSNNQVKENVIYNYAMTECFAEFEGLQSHVDILSKMQHYGVPTRLLDITTNPLMALYFACESGIEKCDNRPDYDFNESCYCDVDSDKFRCRNCSKKADAAVYLLRFEPNDLLIKPYDSDTIEILSSLPRFSEQEKGALKRIAEEIVNTDDKILHEKNASISVENKSIVRRLYHEIRKARPVFDELIEASDLLTNFVCLPLKNNARIIRQSGAFIVYGLSSDPIMEHRYSRENAQKIEYYTRIIIDGNSRSHILEQLRLHGMTKGSVYPELYKVAEYIKENISKNHF